MIFLDATGQVNWTLVSISVGLLMLGVMIALWNVLGFLLRDPSQMQLRAESLKEASSPHAGGAMPKVRQPLVGLLFRNLAKNLYDGNAAYKQKIRTLLTLAGRDDSDTGLWLLIGEQVGLSMLLGVIGALVGLFLLPRFMPGFGSTLCLVIGLSAGALIGRMWGMIHLRMQVNKRKEDIEYTLPDVLDLLVVCVEAGMGLDAALQRVSQESSHIAPELSGELTRLRKEMNSGLPRAEAFSHLVARTGVEEVQIMCSMIIQADKLGTSIADTLRVLSEDNRVRRKQHVEELAAKASIKMTFPLVFFVFPALFIVLLGPAAMKIYTTFVH